MQLFYFVVDEDNQLRKASRHDVESLWRGECRADALEFRLGRRLRLITALCDENLVPVICYFAHLQLKEGTITEESKIDAFEAMSMQKRRRYDSPEARRQFRGWPADWQRQLAVALDIPADRLRKIGLGGPLLMSDLWGIPLEKVVSYFEEAHSGDND